MTAAVRAELVGDNIARTSDIMVSTGAPVLELCSRLARAGIDPAVGGGNKVHDPVLDEIVEAR